MIGYKDDEIFLLSTEEYEKYKAVIPHINTWWWLRSPGYYSDFAAFVYCYGFVDNHGSCVSRSNDAVRPALKISNLDFKTLKIGDRYIKYDFPWIKIDENLAIAEVPIAFRWFDRQSNDYETSEIRHFLKDWLKWRKENESKK